MEGIEAIARIASVTEPLEEYQQQPQQSYEQSPQQQYQQPSHNDYDSSIHQDDGSNGIKRKADDGQVQPQQRAKRNRYITIACNEVRRDGNVVRKSDPMLTSS